MGNICLTTTVNVEVLTRSDNCNLRNSISSLCRRFLSVRSSRWQIIGGAIVFFTKLICWKEIQNFRIFLFFESYFLTHKLLNYKIQPYPWKSLSFIKTNFSPNPIIIRMMMGEFSAETSVDACHGCASSRSIHNDVESQKHHKY